MSFIVALILLLIPLSAHGKEYNISNDSVHQRLYGQFLKYYSGNDAENFYKCTKELCQLYRDHDLPQLYYKMKLNICLYDTEHNNHMKALKTANSMLEEMKDEHFDAYSEVYTGLGTIYESLGNIHMARHYYEEAINNLSPDDAGNKMGIYSRLASLLVFQSPVEAHDFNEKYYKESLTFPAYHQVYLFLDAIINFAVGNLHGFRESYRKYLTYHEQNKGLDNYGMVTLKAFDLASNGHFDKAFQVINQAENIEINNISLFDSRILLYKMQNQYEKALKVAEERAACIDSLNSDMFFTNINEINAQTGLAQAQTKTIKVRQRMFTIILLLAVLIIVLLILIVMHQRRSRRQLSEKNEQLKSALTMAKEGEKMKTEFVRSVSHEIRTPLNAINGFNDVLNTPGIEISPAERADFVNRIRENVQAITRIVDDMLNVAEKNSNELADRSDTIYCNQFFSSILYDYRSKVSSSIELNYTSKLINRQQIVSNKEGLRKILDQLILNAIKFTKKGSIEVHCETSADEKQLLVSVTDTGKGIAKEERSKVFEGFYKSDMFQQGLGLGLTVSKKLANKLGGDLVLDEDYDNGARFVLSLPL